MKIKILSSVHSEGRALDEGQVLDVPENEGLELCGLGRAIRIREIAPVVETAQAAPVAEKATARRK